MFTSSYPIPAFPMPRVLAAGCYNVSPERVRLAVPMARGNHVSQPDCAATSTALPRSYLRQRITLPAEKVCGSWSRKATIG